MKNEDKTSGTDLLAEYATAKRKRQEETDQDPAASDMSERAKYIHGTQTGLVRRSADPRLRCFKGWDR